MRWPDGYDWAALAGVGMLGYGLYLISLPLALIVVGAGLIILGLVGAWMRSRAGGKHG